MKPKTILFACRSCEAEVAEEAVLSRTPPSCECGRERFPHSHRGAGMAGPEAIRHRCAICGCDLKFIDFDKDDRIDATSYVSAQ